MIQSNIDNFIRDDEFISCTITQVDSNGLANIEYSPFKKALYPLSIIVVYEYQDIFYYPLSLEFRLIDNNILYLTEELKIHSALEIFRVLTSSMNKEEKWSNDFKLVVVHVKNEPKYCTKLKQFDISNVDVEHIYE
jgi:hypothetical protein